MFIDAQCVTFPTSFVQNNYLNFTLLYTVLTHINS